MNKRALAQAAAGQTVGEDEFHGLISERSADLLAVMNCLAVKESPRGLMDRPLLGRILAQSTQLVELLDRYGAQHNHKWHALRRLMSTVKRFSDVSCELRHIQSSLPSYRLLPIGYDFTGATDEALIFCTEVTLRAGRQMLREAGGLSLDIPPDVDIDPAVHESLPPGVLPQDRPARQAASVGQTVTALATAFLNVASECKPVYAAGRARPDQYASFVPDPVSEEKLRYLRHRFHNLQSMYDTYVSETQTEEMDENLPVLRGHVSVVFHLLAIATGLIHYYERHVGAEEETKRQSESPLVDIDALLSTAMGYSVSFMCHYIDGARNLCQNMLKSYAEIGEIMLPVPRYRGFHVRPSTLVSKIVLHYGSDVQMKMDDECYDASTPLEIFRANEKINARKRQWLASEIANHPSVRNGSENTDVQDNARQIVSDLAEQGKMMIYQHPLVMPEVPVRECGTLLERVIDEVARLQATGKIDINIDLTITFRGDKRVLSDLELLAEYGYGEDNYGNNIVLPVELAHLRR